VRFCFLVCLFIYAPLQASDVVFETQKHLLQKSPLYLADVAVINSTDEYTSNALKAIKIADTAAEAERLTAQEIIKRIKPSIRAIERHCDCKLQIEIPKEIMNHSLNGEFTEEKLTEKIELGIKEHCPECVIDIENTHLIHGELPDQYIRWSSPIVYRELKGPSMVRVFFDDNLIHPVVYQAYIKIKKPVLKLINPLPAGTVAKREDFQTEMIDTTHETRTFATLDDLVGTELKRTLGAGEFLRMQDLILKYQVKLGDSIKVVMKNSSLELEMSGIAQKNGRVGDNIPVKLATTRKDIFGEVLADGKVGL
jgi:flagella basal body P-ring formation protein FlgA